MIHCNHVNYHCCFNARQSNSDKCVWCRYIVHKDSNTLQCETDEAIDPFESIVIIRSIGPPLVNSNHPRIAMHRAEES